jgi:hypothetical protein
VVGIKADGITFEAATGSERSSTSAAHPFQGVERKPGWVGEAVVGGGARDCAGSTGPFNFLTMTAPLMAAPPDTQLIAGWQVAGKDQAISSPAKIEAWVIALAGSLG